MPIDINLLRVEAGKFTLKLIL
jgi:hypothetical protein